MHAVWCRLILSDTKRLMTINFKRNSVMILQTSHISNLEGHIPSASNLIVVIAVLPQVVLTVTFDLGQMFFSGSWAAVSL